MDEDYLNRDELFSSNLGLVYFTMRRYFKIYMSEDYQVSEDLYQEGCIGLYKAVLDFDVSKGFKFSTYAVPKIRGAMTQFVRDKYNVIKMPGKFYYGDMSEDDKRVKAGLMNILSMDKEIIADSGDTLLFSDILIDYSSTEEFTKIDDNSQINYLLSHLTEVEAYCIKESFIEDRLYRDIAYDLGCTISNVGNSVKKGISKIRKVYYNGMSKEGDGVNENVRV